MQEVLNDCFRCHKVGYETEPSHWHYCNDCVKVCTVCKELKVLWAFDFDFKSAEYKRWHEAKGFGFMNASGHMNECSSCMRTALDSLQAKVVIVKGKPTIQIPGISPDQLQLMLDAMQGKPTAT